MKNTGKEELMGNVVQEGSIASIQSLHFLLVHVGVFSGFLPKAKNMHRRLVIVPCCLAIDNISIYHLQRLHNRVFFFLHYPAQSFFEGLSLKKKKKVKLNETKQRNSPGS